MVRQEGPNMNDQRIRFYFLHAYVLRLIMMASLYLFTSPKCLIKKRQLTLLRTINITNAQKLGIWLQCFLFNVSFFRQVRMSTVQVLQMPSGIEVKLCRSGG